MNTLDIGTAVLYRGKGYCVDGIDFVETSFVIVPRALSASKFRDPVVEITPPAEFFMVHHIYGGTVAVRPMCVSGEPKKIEFGPPWARVNAIEVRYEPAKEEAR